MKTVHVFVSGHEFIGETENNLYDDIISLKNAVKLLYMNTPQGLMRNLQNISFNNDYHGRVDIKNAPGVIWMELQSMGGLYKSYKQAISDITLVQPSIKPGNVIKMN